MKRAIIVAMLAVSAIVICGCKEKTPAEKAAAAAEEAAKASEKSAADASRALDKALSK